MQLIDYHGKIIQVIQMSELNKKFGHYLQEQEPYKNQITNEICELMKSF